MADGSIIIDIEANDTGLQQTLSNVKLQAMGAAASMTLLTAAGQQLTNQCVLQQQALTMISGALTAHTLSSSIAGGAMTSLAAHAGVLTGSFSRAAAGAGNLTTALRQQTTMLTSAVRSMLSSAVSVASTFPVTMRAAGLSAGTGLTSGFTAGVSGLSTAALGAGTRAAGAVYGMAGQFTGAGASAGAQLVSGFRGGVSGMSGAATAGASSARAAFTGAGWHSVGYAIASGIASGIRSGSSLITAAAQSAARNALSAAKQALGIHSPSRVFREQVGKMIPLGMAEGIGAGYGAVEQAMRQAASRLGTLDKNTCIPAAALTMPQTHAAAPASQMANLTVEAPVYLDGREIARASAKYMGQQLAYLEGLT